MATRRKAKSPRRISDNKTLNNWDEDSSNDDNQCIHNDVELTFDVLTIIFKNISARDLHRAAVVCRLWNVAAENEKRIRAATPVVVFDELSDLWRDRHRIVNQLRTKPMFSLMISRPFDESHPAFPLTCFPAPTQTDKSDCSCRVLPSGCSHIVVGNGGVIKDAIELEVTSKGAQKAAWILLPHDKDVVIETICVPRKDVILSIPAKHLKLKEKVQNLFTESYNLQGIILLSNESLISPHLLLHHMKRDLKRALAGSAVTDLAVCKRDESGKMCTEPMAGIAIAISGPNVRCWSIVLRKYTNTKQLVVRRLKRFKKEVQLRKHSVGFMFACEGRGECMFHDKNVESGVFKELFPEVPLIGSFGGAEYGENTVGSSFPTRAHQYSTVFMIVTYG